MRALKPGVIYFAIVFGAGFILGPIRILLLVPRVGVRAAELMEAPIMFAVIITASRWIARRFLESSDFASRLAVGVIGLILMLDAEFALARILQGVSIREYFAGRDAVSGTVYYALLVVFALLPAYWRNHARHA